MDAQERAGEPATAARPTQVARASATTRTTSRRARSRTRSAPAAEPRPAAPTRPSVSIGRHNTGRLENGRELTESETIRLKRPDGDHHGTDELVGLIER